MPKFETCPQALDRLVDQALELLGKAVKPVIVAGPKIRPWGAIESFWKLVDASGYTMANLASTKVFVEEAHAQYMGTYWGSGSPPRCGEIVESSDAYIFAGPVLTDYSTVGYNLLLKAHNLIPAHSQSVKIADAIYNQVQMSDFLTALAEKVTRNDDALIAYNHIRGEAPPPAEPGSRTEITTRYLFSQTEGMLDQNTSLITETGVQPVTRA